MTHVVSSAPAAAPPHLDKYGYNCIGKHVGMALVVGAFLFGGAGTLAWDWGWLFTGITFIGWMLLSLILARVNPGLLNERGQRVKRQTGTKRWDWIIMSVYSILLLATPLAAGLDYRYGWSAPSAAGLKLAGCALLALSFVPLTWSMAVNRFFVPTVRIQAERDHRVTTTGPYRFIRHPGYLGVILQFVALPLSLGTAAAWLPALLGAALYVLRTALEDQTLRAELPGYEDYAQRTRYRLLPGVW